MLINAVHAISFACHTFPSSNKIDIVIELLMLELG